MRNRAKCKKCESIIESFHRHDHVTCKCGEIAIDGGPDYFRCMANELSNIIRVDDEGNEIIPVIRDKEDVKPLDIGLPKPSKQDKIKMLEEIIQGYERLSETGLNSYVTNYDLLSALMLLLSILRDD